MGEQYIYRREDRERREDRYLMSTDAPKEYRTHVVAWFGIDESGDFGVWGFTKTGTKDPGGVVQTYPFAGEVKEVHPDRAGLAGPCWVRLATEACPRTALHALLAAYPGMEIQAVSRGKNYAWVEAYNVDRWVHEFANQPCCVMGLCHTPGYTCSGYLNIHRS